MTYHGVPLRACPFSLVLHDLFTRGLVRFHVFELLAKAPEGEEEQAPKSDDQSSQILSNCAEDSKAEQREDDRGVEEEARQSATVASHGLEDPAFLVRKS